MLRLGRLENFLCWHFGVGLTAVLLFIFRQMCEIECPQDLDVLQEELQGGDCVREALVPLTPRGRKTKTVRKPSKEKKQNYALIIMKRQTEGELKKPCNACFSNLALSKPSVVHFFSSPLQVYSSCY